MPDPNLEQYLKDKEVEISELERKHEGPQGPQRLNQVPWKDLPIEQKLERMRGIIKDLELGQHWQSQRIQELSSHLAALDQHGHQDGKVMIPVIAAHRGGGRAGGPQKKKVEGWF